MTAGIQIFTDRDTIQIDENFRNLFVVASGTGGTISPISGFSAPMIALQVTGLGDYYFGKAPPANGKWWVFDVIGNTPPGNYGLQVFDANGDIVFDTSAKPLRIVDVISATAPGSRAYPSGRQYAVIRGCTGCKHVESSTKAGGSLWENSETNYLYGARVSGTTVIWDWYITYTKTTTDPEQQYAQGETWIYGNTPCTFLVIDVTNF